MALEATCKCGIRYGGLPDDRSVKVICKRAKGGCGREWEHTPPTAVAIKEKGGVPSKEVRAPRPARPAELPRLVAAFDATASRAAMWETVKETHDGLFTAVPGGLEVAVAVHGNGELHTFTEFDTNVDYIRAWMGEVVCIAGETRIADMMRRTMKEDRVKVFLYVGDHCEDNALELVELAKFFAQRGTKIIVLHDCTSEAPVDRKRCASAGITFDHIATITGGAVLPLDPAAIEQVRDVLEAVAVVAAEGRAGLEKKRKAIKAADTLLRLLPPDPPSAAGGARPPPVTPKPTGGASSIIRL